MTSGFEKDSLMGGTMTGSAMPASQGRHTVIECGRRACAAALGAWNCHRPAAEIIEALHV